MAQFFLSRAAGDDDSYSLRFFRDLSAKITALTSIASDVGFVDIDHRPSLNRWSRRSAPPPSAWSPAAWETLAWESLASCQVFVALCSPRYFLNDRCGREWWIFAERLRRHEQATAQRVPALIPVLWSSTAAAGGDPAVPEEEAAVNQLVRLRSLRPRYEAYLGSLAQRIVDLTRTHVIPQLNPDLDPALVPSAFAFTGANRGRVSPPDPRDLAAVTAATQRVHLVVAAASRDEMAPVRNDLQFYGERGCDWAPYHPTLPESLATHARTVAAMRLFDSEIADLDDLPGRIDQARRNNEIVVLLVDSWITKLSAYRRTLVTFDERDEPTIAVLAPTNGTDPETVRHRGELRSDLRGALRRNLARGGQLVRIEIDDTESFEIDLVAVLEEAQNRIFRHGRVFRRPVHDTPADRPILQGP